MSGWIILLIVLAVLFLLLQLRLGGIVQYGPEKLTVKLIAGPIRIGILPSKPQRERKEPKAEKPKKEKRLKKKKFRAAGELPEEKGNTVGRLLRLLPVMCEAAGALKRKIRIDELKVHVDWGGEDAAAAALGYGRAYAVFGMIWPLLDNNFKVKDCDFQVGLDYGRTKPEVSADAALTMTIGQLLAFGVKLLMNWSRSGKSSATQQEA